MSALAVSGITIRLMISNVTDRREAYRTSRELIDSGDAVGAIAYIDALAAAPHVLAKAAALGQSATPIVRP